MSAGIEIPQLMLDIGIIIIAATIFNIIFRMLKQPSFLAYIVAGLTLGIGFNSLAGKCLGLLVEGVCTGIPFAGSAIGSPEDIAILSELGVAFLLFSVGVESDFLKIKKIGKMLLIGGIIQVALSTIFIFLALTTFFSIDPMQAILFGLILSFSSTMIVIKLLSDQFQIDTLHGRMMVGFLLVQDILVIILLPIASNASAGINSFEILWLIAKSLMLIILAPILGHLLFPKFFKEIVKSPELTFLTGLSTAFIFMFISEAYLGLPIALGAFVAGISLSTLPYNLQIYEEIRGVRDFFVTIFFVTLGINITFSIAEINFGLLGLAILFVLLIKPLIFYLIILFFGYGHRIGLISALGLSQVSEFSLILANEGLTKGFLDPTLYTATVIVMSTTMILTPYFFKYIEFLNKFTKNIFKFFPKSLKPIFFSSQIRQITKKESEDNEIVIVGGGVMGSAIAKTIHKKTTVLCVEKNPDNVKALKKQGVNAIYGDANYRSIWEKLNLEKAKLLIIAVPDASISSKLLFYAKANFKHVKVFCRADNFNDALILYHRKADLVIVPKVLGANNITQEIINVLDGKSMGENTPLQDEIITLLEEETETKKFMPDGKLGI